MALQGAKDCIQTLSTIWSGKQLWRPNIPLIWCLKVGKYQLKVHWHKCNGEKLML
jgi:hypothetical protein